MSMPNTSNWFLVFIIIIFIGGLYVLFVEISLISDNQKTLKENQATITAILQKTAPEDVKKFVGENSKDIKYEISDLKQALSNTEMQLKDEVRHKFDGTLNGIDSLKNSLEKAETNLAAMIKSIEAEFKVTQSKIESNLR